MAAHYATAILPARPRKPRDKTKVEQAAPIVERWRLGRLRRRIFHSLGRGQRRARRFDARPQRGASAPPARRHSPTAVGGDRPPGAQAAADDGVRVRGVEELPRRHRLPRRGRQPLLQRAAPLPARRGRGAADGAHGRGFPSGRADRRPSARRRQSQAYDAFRAHALQPSPLRRLDARPHPRRRPPHRRGDGGAVRGNPGIAPPSRAGLPSLPGHRPALRLLRCGAAGGAAERALEIGAKTYGQKTPICQSILDNSLDRRPATARPAETTPILHPNIPRQTRSVCRGPRYYN